MNLLLFIGAAALILAGIVAAYTLFTDPARISEEEDAVVDDATPAQRKGFLSRFRRKSNEQVTSDMADLGQSEFSDQDSGPSD